MAGLGCEESVKTDINRTCRSGNGAAWISREVGSSRFSSVDFHRSIVSPTLAEGLRHGDPASDLFEASLKEAQFVGFVGEP